MSTLQNDLVAKLQREVGDLDDSNRYYTNDQLFSAIDDGLQDYNEEMFQQYSIVGSSTTAYFSPDPGVITQRLLVLFSARALMRGELAKQARQAIVHTNPAGRTDLSQRPGWTDKIVERYDKKIAKVKLEISRQKVEEELEDDGAMELKNKKSGGGVEGLSILSIEETV